MGRYRVAAFEGSQLRRAAAAVSAGVMVLSAGMSSVAHAAAPPAVASVGLAPPYYMQTGTPASFGVAALDGNGIPIPQALITVEVTLSSTAAAQPLSAGYLDGVTTATGPADRRLTGSYTTPPSGIAGGFTLSSLAPGTLTVRAYAGLAPRAANAPFDTLVVTVVTPRVGQTTLTPADALTLTNATTAYHVSALDLSGLGVPYATLYIAVVMRVDSPTQPLVVTGLTDTVSASDRSPMSVCENPPTPPTACWTVSGRVSAGLDGTAAFTVAASVPGRVQVVLSPDPLGSDWNWANLIVDNDTWAVTGVESGATYTMATAPVAGCLKNGIPVGPARIETLYGGQNSGLVRASCGPATLDYAITDLAPTLVVPAAINVAATSPAGAAVSFTVSSFPTAVCDHTSGSLFPIGTTTVDCGILFYGSTVLSQQFVVTVTQVPAVTPPAVIPPPGTPPAVRLPTVHVPASIHVTTKRRSGTKVSYTVTATDPVDGALSVTCSRASGSNFAVGTTKVTCKATNSLGKSTSASFKVYVKRRR